MNAIEDICYGHQSVPIDHQKARPPDEVHDQDHNDNVVHEDVAYDPFDNIVLTPHIDT